MQNGQVGIQLDRRPVELDRIFIIAGGFEDIAAGPAGFERIGVQRQRRSGDLPGFVDVVEGLGIDQDLDPVGMRNGIVGIKLQGLIDRFLSFAVLPLLKIQRPGAHGMRHGIVRAQQDGVLGIGLGLTRQTGKHLDARQGNIQAGILGGGFDRLLVGFNGLGQFPILEERLGFVRQRFRGACRRGGCLEGIGLFRQIDPINVISKEQNQAKNGPAENTGTFAAAGHAPFAAAW